MIAIGEVLKAKGRSAFSIPGSATVSELIERFTDTTARCLAVTDGGALIGVVTIRDVLTYIGQHRVAALGSKVQSVMTRDVTSITPDMRLDAAAALFAENTFHHLPVVEHGVLVGMVTPADVLSGHVAHLRDEAVFLRDYISGVYT